MTEYLILKLVAALGVGIAVGGGLMVLGLAKWGRKFFQGDQGEQGNRGDRGDRGSQGIPGDRGNTGSTGNTGRGECPFAGDHPTLQAFMGESLSDRKDMRDFLEDINGQVRAMGSGVSEMKGKLDLLLQGARVRWNSGLIPADKS